MITAYDKTYLEKAQTNMGRMLDFAVYELKYPLSEFYGLFIASGIADYMGNGDFRFITGMSGVELALAVLEKNGIQCERTLVKYTENRSREYWAGWALAYYQWKSCRTYQDIDRLVPITDILALYAPYHEMDIRQFSDRMDELCRKAEPETKLKMRRMKAGLSQRQLSELSDVPLRTIQQYEQRQKKIDQCQSITLFKLSKALFCPMEELLDF